MSKATEPKPGVIRDPWRTVTPPASAQVTAAPTVSEEVAHKAGDDINEDMQEVVTATITLKNYGGITVTGAKTPAHAAAQVLEFCVDNLRAAEATLISFGIVVAKLQRGPMTTPFYVQRKDGWTLAIPMVRTRDEGCLQLIQALIALNTHPTMRAKMRDLNIVPYKI